MEKTPRQLYYRKRAYDGLLVTLYISLVIIGWLMLYSATAREWMGSASFWSSSMGKQTLWLVLAVGVFWLFQIVEWKYWFRTAYLFYALGIVLLVIVLIWGREIKGARSWLYFGGWGFQPSEVAKFTTLLGLSAYLSHYGTDMRRRASQLVAAGLVMMPAVLVALQPDWGTAMVFSAFVLVFYRAGLPVEYFIVGAVAVMGLLGGLLVGWLKMGVVVSVLYSLVVVWSARRWRWVWLLWLLGVGGLVYVHFWGGKEWEWIVGLYHLLVAELVLFIRRWYRWAVVGAGLVLMAVGLAWSSEFAFREVLKPHQQERINVWLFPHKADPQGSAYNVLQSKLAIGSGGLWGKGFRKGRMTELNYVPEQTTDFIFTTVGEEQGFVGSVAVLAIFLMLMWRLVVLAERVEHDFMRFYLYGVASLLFFHVFVNVGMTLGLVPIIGIPLPFISQGGSALVVFSLMLAVALRMGREA